MIKPRQKYTREREREEGRGGRLPVNKVQNNKSTTEKEKRIEVVNLVTTKVQQREGGREVVVSKFD